MLNYGHQQCGHEHVREHDAIFILANMAGKHVWRGLRITKELTQNLKTSTTAHRTVRELVKQAALCYEALRCQVTRRIRAHINVVSSNT